MRSVRSLGRALLLCSALVALPSVAAEGFHTASVSALYGWTFDDALTGSDTPDGQMATLTLEHFTVWALGDSFLFLDFAHGRFEDEQLGHRMYAEWNPRLSFSKVSGTPLAFGPIKDVLLVGEVNQGYSGFFAGLIGLGVDFQVPFFPVLQLHAFLRQDNFNPATWQTTAVWLAPFALGPVKLQFGGFIDVYGRDDGGLDVLTQPQLLLDVGALATLPEGKLHLGVEWYLHHSALGFTSAPQAMFRWSL